MKSAELLDKRVFYERLRLAYIKVWGDDFMKNKVTFRDWHGEEYTRNAAICRDRWKCNRLLCTHFHPHPIDDADDGINLGPCRKNVKNGKRNNTGCACGCSSKMTSSEENKPLDATEYFMYVTMNATLDKAHFKQDQYWRWSGNYVLGLEILPIMYSYINFDE